MSNELEKLRESIKRSAAVIAGRKELLEEDVETTVELDQTETEEPVQTEEPPLSE